MKYLKRINKQVKIIITIAAFTILPLAIFTLVTSKTTALGVQSFVVLTGSMQPTIPVGSIVYTKKDTWYPVGSIIAFKSGDLTITHRVVKAVNRDNVLYYTTRGDANNTNDSKEVTNSDVLGKELIFIPYVGRVSMFLATPIGFFSIIFFPLSVFIILEIWNLKKEIEREVEKKLQQKMGLT